MIPQLYDTFKHWSKKGSVWIYSDPHFEDSDCKLMDANWVSPDEQIDIINSKVHKGDTLILLGDIGNPEYVKRIKAGYKVLIAGNHDAGLTNYKKKIITKMKEIKIDSDKIDDYEKAVSLEMLNFRKELSKEYPYSRIDIDEMWDFHSPFHYFKATIDNNLFDEVYGGPLFIGEKILLSHEPIDIPFGLNIHGHTHALAGGHDGYGHWNVCANCVNFEPVNLKTLIDLGFLNIFPTIHRLTINEAIERKKNE